MGFVITEALVQVQNLTLQQMQVSILLQVPQSWLEQLGKQTASATVKTTQVSETSQWSPKDYIIRRYSDITPEDLTTISKGPGYTGSTRLQSAIGKG